MGRKIGKILIVLGIIFFMNKVGIQAEEIPKPYQVKYEKPDGENEYYTEAPEVEIEHFDEMLITRYRMKFPDETELTGKLDKEENKAVIQSVLFQEGENRLEIWMENKEGERIEGTETEKIFKVDGTGPEEPLEFVYQKNDEAEILCFSSETELEIKASDSVSGIMGIYYQMNDQEEQFLEGETIKIAIPVGFEGKVTAYAVDKAGNKGKTYYSKELICENEGAEIAMQAPQGFECWYNQPLMVEAVIWENRVQSGIKSIVCYVNEEIVEEKTCDFKTEKENILIPIKGMSTIKIEVEDYAGNKSAKRQQILYDNQNPQIEVTGAENYTITSDPVSLSCMVTDEQRIVSLSGKMVCRDTEGKETITEIPNWKKDGETYHTLLELNEDGIYQLEFHVQDEAGNQTGKKHQVIIDKGNPVISQIKQFHGKYLQVFQWNYQPEEIVQDFTSYTYAVYLDKRICEPGVLCVKEGQHILEVTAKDAAGNQSKAKAIFIIDRTVPQILLKNIKEGMVYEKGVEASVTVENEADMIEYIYIDGVQQEYNQKEGVFCYLFQDPGRHTIRVSAKDLAGNRSEKEVVFTVKEKSLLTGNIIPRYSSREKKMQNDDSSSESRISILGVIGIIVIVLGGV